VDQVQGDLRQQRVMQLLRGFEWQLDEQAFLLLPDNCWEELLQISNDRNVKKLIRARAAAALTLYPNDKVWYELVSRISYDRSRVMRRRSTEQVCKAFSDSRARAVEEKMISLLADKDPQVRVLAARCLQPGKSEAASSALTMFRSELDRAEDSRFWEFEAAGFKADRTIE